MQPEDFEPKYPGRLQNLGQGIVAFVPNLLPPKFPLTAELRQQHDSALLALGELRAVVTFLPNPRLLTSPFLRREAVLSSKIEGTKTGIEQLYEFEESEAPAKADHLQDDAREVFNYVDALEYGLGQLEKFPICNRLLKQMHARLLTGVTDDRGLFKNPGEFRKEPAYIGGADPRTARYVAAPPNEIERLMADLEKYVNTPPDDFPTLIRIALIHYQFEAIHPFADGNGRLGRLLISLMLTASEILPQPLLYLSAYFERRRKEYNAHLWETSRAGAWAEWVLYFLQGVAGEAADAVARAQRLLALREAYRAEMQKTSRSAGALLTLVDLLFSHPALTVNRAAEATGLTYQGALKNVDKLIALGVLSDVPFRVRNQVYFARPILELLK